MTAFGLLALEAGTAVAVRGSTGAALAMGGALGLGLLTKGPHALYVPLTALGGGCLAAGRPGRLLDPRWLLALLVAVGVFAAWLVPALAAGGHLPAYNSADTFRERLLGQIARRVGGENEPHEAPFWYLLVLVLPFALPWTPLWIAGLAARRRRRDAPLEERFGLGAVTAGILVPLLLLSVPSSKRELYLLPLLPCASLLAAWVLHRAADSGAVRHSVRSVVGVFAGLAVGAFLTPILAGTSLLPVRDVDRPALASLTQGLVPFAFGGVGALLLVGAVATFLARARPVTAARAAGLSLGAAWLVIVLAVLPAFDRWKSFEGARAAGEAAAPGAPLASAGFADASILWGFHRDRLLQLGLRGEAEAARLLAPAAPTHLLLAKEKHWTRMLARAAPSDADLLRRARPVWRDAVGGVVYVLLTNAAP
jgi:4-amino-4-deoxy-L-arabinose transferase-like glycosyltransferase